MKIKYIIISAPSGAGKSTLIKELVKKCTEYNFGFSVSLTTRAPRNGEIPGVHYQFVSHEVFKQHISKNDFLEYEEVHGNFYGTLKSPVEQMNKEGKVVIFDLDVKGACNIKKYFGDNALSIFVKTQNLEILRQRLENRGTESKEVIDKRMSRAEMELSFATKFDVVIINDELERASEELVALVKSR